MGKTVQPEPDWLDLIDEPPIVPESGSYKDNAYASVGWKYYLKIKDKLPDWWDEFNTALDKQGRLKHKNIRRFIDSITKKSDERQYLYWMIGPRPLEEEGRSQKENGHKVVPWLGDWYKRRKNGYWFEDNKLQVRQLQKAINENLESAQTIKASVPFLIQDLMKVNRLIGKLDELFGGSPFLMDDSPTSKGNILRFNNYTKYFSTLQELKFKTIREIMRVMGVNPEKPNEMWSMAQLAAMSGQIGASAALTGAMANSNGMLLPPGPDGTPGISLSKDALLIAHHLSQHGTIFKKPLPELVIDGDEVKEKSNGKHKTQ